VKRSLLVDADGGPLAITIAGANVPDARLLGATNHAIFTAVEGQTRQPPGGRLASNAEPIPDLAVQRVVSGAGT